MEATFEPMVPIPTIPIVRPHSSTEGRVTSVNMPEAE